MWPAPAQFYAQSAQKVDFFIFVVVFMPLGVGEQSLPPSEFGRGHAADFTLFDFKSSLHYMDLYSWIFTIDSWLPQQPVTHLKLGRSGIILSGTQTADVDKSHPKPCRSTYRSISPKVCYHGYVDCRCLLHIFRHHHGTPLTGVDADLLYR